jgi:hypothetical protein
MARCYSSKKQGKRRLLGDILYSQRQTIQYRALSPFLTRFILPSAAHRPRKGLFPKNKHALATSVHDPGRCSSHSTTLFSSPPRPLLMLIEFHIQTATTIEPANKAASFTLINTAHQAAYYLVGYHDTTAIKNSTITKSSRIRGIYAITTSIYLSFHSPQT